MSLPEYVLVPFISGALFFDRLFNTLNGLKFEEDLFPFFSPLEEEISTKDPFPSRGDFMDSVFENEINAGAPE